jgi:hypothetical protein
MIVIGKKFLEGVREVTHLVGTTIYFERCLELCKESKISEYLETESKWDTRFVA